MARDAIWGAMSQQRRQSKLFYSFLRNSLQVAQILIVPLNVSCHVFAVYPSSRIQPSRAPLGPSGFKHGNRIRWTYFGSAPFESEVFLMQRGATAGDFPEGSQFPGSLRSCRCLSAAFMTGNSQRRLTAAVFVWTFPTWLLESLFFKLYYAVSCLGLLSFQNFVVFFLKGAR